MRLTKNQKRELFNVEELNNGHVSMHSKGVGDERQITIHGQTHGSHFTTGGKWRNSRQAMSEISGE
jgi:hypothetical protein